MHASSRPRLADLCCKGGGAARGYDAAGFDVTGYDIVWQKNYPFHCWERDVLHLDPVEMGEMYDAFHASPSCKGYTALRTAHNAKTHAREIPAFVDWLNATGKPWVLENVEEAAKEMHFMVLERKAVSLIMLCGSQFNLGTQGHRLERHRMFLANFPLLPPDDGGPFGPGVCIHDPNIPVVGVYGGHARNRSAKFGGRTTKDSWIGGHRTAMAQALGLPVGAMTVEEMSEAIPPAYTSFVGAQLMKVIRG